MCDHGILTCILTTVDTKLFSFHYNVYKSGHIWSDYSVVLCSLAVQYKLVQLKLVWRLTGASPSLCQLVDKRLMDGADEFLQLMDLCSVIMDQLCHTQSH